MTVCDYKCETFFNNRSCSFCTKKYVWTTFGSWTIQWRLPCHQATTCALRTYVNCLSLYWFVYWVLQSRWPAFI